MDVLVRLGSAKTGVVPRWMGGRMPLSTELSEALRARLDAAARGEFDGPEMRAVAPLLEVQSRWSRIPLLNELLIERWQSRDGHHLFLYPFAGRLVHEGLAALWAWRLGAGSRTHSPCRSMTTGWNSSQRMRPRRFRTGGRVARHGAPGRGPGSQPEQCRDGTAAIPGGGASRWPGV